MDTLSKKVIDAGDTSGNLTSDIINLQNVLHIGVHAVWSGAPAGNIIYEVSAEKGQPTVFEPLDTVAVAGAGSQLWLDRNAPYLWARVRYVGAGAGVLNVSSTTKGDE